MWHLSEFQAGEIVNLAVEIEKTGYQFYKKLAEKAPNEQLRSLLLYLAEEEGQHQIRFKELGKGLAQASAPETYPGEYVDYIESIVEAHMFNDSFRIEQMVKIARSGLDIIKLATDFEKDTILFLNGFRFLVPKDKQGIVDDLIMEEHIHLVKLSRLRKEVLIQDGK